MNKGTTMNMVLKKSFCWLLPDTSLFSPFDLSRLKILNSIHLLFLGFSLVMIYLDWFVIPENHVPTFLPIIATLTLHTIFKQWGNIILSGNLACLFFYLVMLPSITPTGGLYSDNLIWLMIIPILAFLLTNQWSGLGWFGVLAATLIYYYTKEINSAASFRELTLNYSPDYYLTSWGFLFAIITLIILLFSKGKDELITSLLQSQQQLLAQQEEIKKQAAQVKENEQKLSKLNQKLEHFAYAISHDLKEPLRTIKVYIQILEKSLDSSLTETDREYMAFVQNGADRMHTLLIDLLEYSRIADNEASRKNISLNDVMLIVKNQLNATIQENQAEVIITNKLQTLSANVSLLIMLFQNLINNAIKFSVPERQAKVAISSSFDSDNNLIVHVQDNGIGIPKKYQEKIFDIFTKIHTKDQYEGSGIGLSTCQKIMESMNGAIWLDSTPGEGTTFHLLFPKERLIKSSLHIKNWSNPKALVKSA